MWTSFNCNLHLLEINIYWTQRLKYKNSAHKLSDRKYTDGELVLSEGIISVLPTCGGTTMVNMLYFLNPRGCLLKIIRNLGYTSLRWRVPQMHLAIVCKTLWSLSSCFVLALVRPCICLAGFCVDRSSRSKIQKNIHQFCYN